MYEPARPVLRGFLISWHSADRGGAQDVALVASFSARVPGTQIPRLFVRSVSLPVAEEDSTRLAGKRYNKWRGLLVLMRKHRNRAGLLLEGNIEIHSRFRDGFFCRVLCSSYFNTSKHSLGSIGYRQNTLFAACSRGNMLKNIFFYGRIFVNGGKFWTFGKNEL